MSRERGELAGRPVVCLAGHAGWGSHDLVEEDRSVSYWTLLRDPVARWVSDLNYVRMKRGDTTVLQFLRSDPPNLLTRMLGNGNLELAKDRLSHQYRFFGLTEAMDEFFCVLRHGFRLRERRFAVVNKTRPQEYFEPTDNELEQFLGLNTLDVELYRWARALFFDRYQAWRRTVGPTVPEVGSLIRDQSLRGSDNIHDNKYEGIAETPFAPSNAHEFLKKARACLESKDVRQAIPWFERSIEENRAHVLGLFNAMRYEDPSLVLDRLWWAFRELKALGSRQRDGAVNVLAVRILRAIAAMYRQLRDTAAADRAYYRALAINPNDIVTIGEYYYHNLNQACTDDGELEASLLIPDRVEVSGWCQRRTLDALLTYWRSHLEPARVDAIQRQVECFVRREISGLVG